MPAKDVTTILTQTELRTIIAQYDPVALGQLLPFALVTRYPSISPYLEAIGRELYPEFQGQPAVLLDAANRERCLVALLASHSRRLELAIHVYMALASKVDPGELAHIVLAAGIYSGVDTVDNGLAVMQRTLEILKELVATNKAAPKDVLTALSTLFP